MNTKVAAKIIAQQAEMAKVEADGGKATRKQKVGAGIGSSSGSQVAGP